MTTSKSKSPPSTRNIDIEMDHEFSDSIENPKQPRDPRDLGSPPIDDRAELVHPASRDSIAHPGAAIIRAHRNEPTVLDRLKDGPRHEIEACNDRALVQLLEKHELIRTYPADTRGLMLELTDKGRAKL
jgi:hypothetical protein